MEKINWKNPEFEIPKEGDVVVALQWHWKHSFPGSMEIMGGYVEYNNAGDHWRVQSNDESGLGGYCVDGDELEAWCYAEEFLPAFPDFLKIYKD